MMVCVPAKALVATESNAEAAPMEVEGCQVEVAEVTPHPEEQAMAVATTVEAKAEDKARSRASSTARRVVCAKKACCPVLNAAPAFNRGVAEAAMQAHNLTDWAGLSSSMVQHRLCELGVHVQYSDAEALLRKQRRGVARDNLALLLSLIHISEPTRPY